MSRRFHMLLYTALVFAAVTLFSALTFVEQADTISELDFVTYDGALYSPGELRALTEEQRAAGHVGWDYDYYATDFSRVRTNQLVLRLTPGETYGLYTEQLTYAANLWIDGRLVAQSGVVSATPEGFVPRTGSVVVYFTAGEETEIVMQRCNFCHAKWNAVQFYLGPQAVITRQVQARQFREIMYLGFLAALGMLNLGMFFGMPDRRRYLWFSLSCFSTMLHQSLLDPKLIMTVLPDLNWYVSYKAENISLILLLGFMALCMRDIFGKPRLKWADPALLGALGASVLFILALPTTLFTRYTVQLAACLSCCAVAYLAQLLARALRGWKELLTAQKYCLAGLLVFMLNAVLALLRIGPRHTNMLQIGMVLFEQAITLALAMEFQDVRQAFLQSRRSEEQLRAMNENMEQTQRLQENFMAIMNHEMRTPLTVIAGYADLAARRVARLDPPDEETARNLQLVKAEALRLGRIVEKSDEGARSGIVSSNLEEVNVRRLLEDARDFCAPICEKRGNAIDIDCPGELALTCMRDSVLQSLYNLILNATRHTRKGLIRLTARRAEGAVLLSVADDGEGMDEETRAHAFERGYTRDGRHGLGLTLCKEVADRHGGSIRIDGNENGGVTVNMALPEHARVE